MKLQIRKCALFFYTILFFCFSALNLNSAVAQNNQTKALNLFDLLKNNIEGINDLNYYNSTNLIIKLPGNRHFILDWGFKGAGNILEAFPEVNPRLVNVSDDNSIGLIQSDGNKTFDWTDLAKVVVKSQLKNIIKDEIQNYNEYIPGFSWLLDSDVSPLKIFALKLFLLMRHPFPEGFEFKRKVELLRLVFRLSQSKIHDLIDKERPLLNYLPQELQTILEDNISVEWRQLIEDMWKGLSLGFDNYEFFEDGSYDKSKAGRSVRGFVFDDISVARNCFNRLSSKNVKISDIEEEIKNLVGSAYEIVEHQDYLDFHGQSLYKFIGHKDFGRITDETSNISVVLKNEISKVQDLPKLIKVEVSNNEIWLLYVSEKLSLFDALKFSSASLFKAFKEYEAIKVNLPEQDNIKDKNNSVEDSEYANRLAELYAKKQDLKNRINGNLIQLQKAENDLNKKNQKSNGSSLDKKLIQIATNKVNSFKENEKRLKSQLAAVESNIKIIERNPFNIFGSDKDSSNKDSQNQGYNTKNILKLIADTFINSPELNGMIDAVNSDLPVFKELKENLFKRIVGILKNTDNLNTNLEVYKYLVSVLFPDFSNTFEKLTQDLKSTSDIDDITDSLLKLVIK